MAKKRIHLTESEFRTMVKKMVTEAVQQATSSAEFMNREMFYDAVYDILEKYTEKHFSEECSRFGVPEDLIEEYADWFVNRNMENMKRYVHMESTHMDGNFADIKYDYAREHNGADYRKIVSMIDNGISNEQTEEFKEWTIGWFWEAFGTFGLTYNFSDSLANYFEEYDSEVNESRKRRRAINRTVKNTSRKRFISKNK